MNVSQRRFAFTALATVIALVVLLFGGVGATALAAQSALPGDALYSLKTGLEQTQVSLSRSAYNRAQLQMGFAERRLDEIAGLISEGRFNDIGKAVEEFERHIQASIGELQGVAAGDPARATELATQVSSALSRYALTLGGMLANVPDTVKPEVERALMASQNVAAMGEEFEFTGTVTAITQDAWTVGEFTVAVSLATEIKDVIVVGDVVKIHAFEDTNGVLTAREIELFMGDDNANMNMNDNSNDDNVNENDNANDDNSNMNSNDNDDDHNVNSNMNSNDNDDDHNVNSNMNSNDDDDHNTNSNMNSNDDDDENHNINSNDNNNDNSNLNTNHNNNDNQNTNDNHNVNDNRNSNDDD